MEFVRIYCMFVYRRLVGIVYIIHIYLNVDILLPSILTPLPVSKTPFLDDYMMAKLVTWMVLDVPIRRPLCLPEWILMNRQQRNMELTSASGAHCDEIHHFAMALGPGSSALECVCIINGCSAHNNTTGDFHLLGRVAYSQISIVRVSSWFQSSVFFFFFNWKCCIR